MKSPPPAVISSARQFRTGCCREMDELIGQDGTVDLVCDPGMEIPLELENRTLTLSELLEALQYKRSWSEMKGKSEAA